MFKLTITEIKNMTNPST